MGNVSSCCESCCEYLGLLSLRLTTIVDNAFQSIRVGHRRMSLYFWKMSERQWQISSNTLRVRLHYIPRPTSGCGIYAILADRTTTNFFTGSPLTALTTLSFSDNVDLQRSAALAFAEITEKEVRPVGRDTLDPILFLLSSHDTEVQRAASAALGNLAVNSMLPSTSV